MDVQIGQTYSTGITIVPAPMDNMSKNKPSKSITHIPLLRSVVRSSKRPWPGNCEAAGCAVKYCARAAQAFSAGIKCRHCKIVSTMYFQA